MPAEAPVISARGRAEVDFSLAIGPVASLRAPSSNRGVKPAVLIELTPAYVPSRETGRESSPSGLTRPRGGGETASARDKDLNERTLRQKAGTDDEGAVDEPRAAGGGPGRRQVGGRPLGVRRGPALGAQPFAALRPDRRAHRGLHGARLGSQPGELRRADRRRSGDRLGPQRRQRHAGPAARGHGAVPRRHLPARSNL